MVRISTYTGSFNVIDPDPSDISLTDIAHALSNLSRFNGHTLWHYSVAQHSVLVSKLVEPEHALSALMHDAAEAYVGDVVRPIRAVIPEFDLMEDRVARVLADHFGYQWPISEAVKKADDMALEVELRELFTHYPKTRSLRAPVIHRTIPAMSPEEAKKAFLVRAKALIKHA